MVPGLPARARNTGGESREPHVYVTLIEEYACPSCGEHGGGYTSAKITVLVKSIRVDHGFRFTVWCAKCGMTIAGTEPVRSTIHPDHRADIEQAREKLKERNRNRATRRKGNTETS